MGRTDSHRLQSESGGIGAAMSDFTPNVGPPRFKADLRGQRCGCSTCGEVFGGCAGFDDHRVGPHGPSRRCRTGPEIAALGYTTDDSGVWRLRDGARKPREAGKTRAFAVSPVAP